MKTWSNWCPVVLNGSSVQKGFNAAEREQLVTQLSERVLIRSERPDVQCEPGCDQDAQQEKRSSAEPERPRVHE
jgi:hypothetical protein